MKTMKLKVLRVIFIIMLSTIWVATLIIKKTYHYPVEWLLHYIVGTGKDKIVPTQVMQSALPDLLKLTTWDGRKKCGKHFFHSTTLYNGAGFYKRPALFYLIGCFTFYIHKTTKGHIIIGRDVYDWNPTVDKEGNQQYFTSPLGDSKSMVFMCYVLGKIFGDDLFVTEGFPMGEAGISNKLWYALEKVGAKPFVTHFKIEYTKQEAKEALAKVFKKEED